MQDIQKLTKIAGAEDPQAALEKERDEARERMAANRAKAANVRGFPDEADNDNNKVQLFSRIFRHRQPQDHVAALAGGAPGPLAGTSGRGTFRSEAGF
jgi:hypothetical protein